MENGKSRVRLMTTNHVQRNVTNFTKDNDKSNKLCTIFNCKLKIFQDTPHNNNNTVTEN